MNKVVWSEVLPWEEIITKDALEASDEKHSTRFDQLKHIIEADKASQKEINDQLAQMMNLQGQISTLLTTNGIKKTNPTREDDAFLFLINPQEKRVKSAWNEAVLQEEADTFQNISEKNKVVLPSKLRLQWANEEVLSKLSAIQDCFRAVLVPYEHWAQRVAIEMSRDFQQIAIFARTGSVNWVTLLEAIFQVLADHQVLYGSMVSFFMLLLIQNESMLNFTRRMREAWYKLPTTYRQGVMNREGVINLLRQYTPSIWMMMKDNSGNWSTTEMIEQAVTRSQMMA
ncbi:Uu.00g053890.m01.CDS01 [Anthostomella pinea]|uniref:Uu.00g053890.m01.CDS01 n=1 Tax=Anthostomella pinea TaxID=933095 RepID=A0AAI8VX84_9PEZI|nr:Uu.00g053890.m01.CDS01 [Anthostomella pinea]